MQYKIISCGTYCELSTRSRCHAVIYIETDNICQVKWIEIKYIYIHVSDVL